MRKTLIAIAMALALVLIPVGTAFAATSDTVTVTATPGFVSITVTPDSWPAGVVNAGSTPDTGGDYFTINNSSTVDMDLTTECDGWTDIAAIPEGVAWTYNDTAGADTGSLNFSYEGGAYTYIPETPAPAASMATDVTPATDPNFDLQLEAPTSFTHIDEQQSVVTVTAAPS